jgi:hypothetical protein
LKDPNKQLSNESMKLCNKEKENKFCNWMTVSTWKGNSEPLGQLKPFRVDWQYHLGMFPYGIDPHIIVEEFNNL